MKQILSLMNKRPILIEFFTGRLSSWLVEIQFLELHITVSFPPEGSQGPFFYNPNHDKRIAENGYQTGQAGPKAQVRVDILAWVPA